MALECRRLIRRQYHGILFFTGPESIGSVGPLTPLSSTPPPPTQATWPANRNICPHLALTGLAMRLTKYEGSALGQRKGRGKARARLADVPSPEVQMLRYLRNGHDRDDGRGYICMHMNEEHS